MKKEIQKMCSDWDGSDEEFIKIITLVKDWISYKNLAVEFEVAESTVSRWSIGITFPLPRMQKQIIKYIQSILDNN